MATLKTNVMNLLRVKTIQKWKEYCIFMFKATLQNIPRHKRSTTDAELLNESQTLIFFVIVKIKC